MKDGLQVLVTSKVAEADDIASFEFAATSGEVLPAYTPGAHIDVRGPSGEIRQYSLCATPSREGLYRIAVLREAQGRGGSRAMHEQVHVGDTLQISRPRNLFELGTAGPFAVLMAGGIGITPILPMAWHLQSAGRKFSLDYCARTPARMAFRQEILDSPFAAHTTLHFDDGGAQQQLDMRARLLAAAPGAHLYVCGPRGFIEAALSLARSMGWSEERLHREFFAGAAIERSADDAFEVVIARTGQVVPVPAGSSVVGALAARGILIETSCEQGVCGTCLTRVLDGVPDHRDSFLTPGEQAACDQFTPCCSRSKSSRLVLDL